MVEKFSLKDELFNAKKVYQIGLEIREVFGIFEPEHYFALQINGHGQERLFLT